MNRLFLLRHAKSSWDDPELDDHDRPLAPRGESAAPAMGRYMAGQGLLPDFVMCSTALRARQTLDAAMTDWPTAPEIAYESAIYNAESADLLSLVQGLDDGYRSVLLVGHNPGLEELAQLLAGRGEGDSLQRLANKFPTAALAVIEADIDHWHDLTEERGVLTRFITPKALES